jgi:hypothetical protein
MNTMTEMPVTPLFLMLLFVKPWLFVPARQTDRGTHQRRPLFMWSQYIKMGIFCLFASMAGVTAILLCSSNYLASTCLLNQKTDFILLGARAVLQVALPFMLVSFTIFCLYDLTDFWLRAKKRVVVLTKTIHGHLLPLLVSFLCINKINVKTFVFSQRYSADTRLIVAGRHCLALLWHATGVPQLFPQTQILQVHFS